MKKIYIFLIIIGIFVMIAGSEKSFAQLSGTYTIGGTTPSYVSFTAAVTALSAQGVSGPVIFNVRPATYTEQVSFPAITGASSVNTITFISENNDSTSVILTAAGSASANPNYTVQLNGADYITFSKITLERTGTLAFTTVVDIRNSSNFNSFTNNIIRNEVVTGFSSGNALVANQISSADSINTFSYNIFNNGSFGLYYFGTSGLAESGTVISDNVFNNQTTYSMQLFYQRNIVITRNRLNSSVANFATAIYLSNGSGNSFVSQNRINLTAGGSGISFLQTSGSVSADIICANNFIHVEGGTLAYGIRCSACSYMGIYFNSVNITSTFTTNNSALEMLAAGSVQNKVKNNILANQFSRCVSVNNAATTQMDYNDLLGANFNFASYNGTTQNNFATWKTSSGFDSNSVSLNPLFFSVSDLHIGNFALNNIGVPAGNVTVDIDNQSRNSLTPDIGADEITPANDDAGIIRLIKPNDGQCGNPNTVVSAIVKNFAGVPQTNVTATVQVTGSITATLTGSVAGPIPVFGSDTIVFSPALNTTAGGLLRFVVYTTIAADQDHTNDTLVVDSVEIQPIPPAPTLSASPTACPGDTATVTATFGAGYQVYWYNSASGGSSIYTGNPLKVIPHAPTTYYAEVRDTAATGGGCLRITECELNDFGGNGDYIEIQNCSANSIDATGWFVAVSNSYTDINQVNATKWNLGAFAPGEIQVRYDANTTGPYYWGENIFWNGSTTSGGWAMIVDNNGVIVDFVSWNWTLSQIQSIALTINGFPLTPGTDWTGDGTVSCLSGSVSRMGTTDNDNATDFGCPTQTYNAQNANLSVPLSCSAGGCPSARVPVFVNVLSPIINLGNDTIIVAPNTVTLNAGTGFTSYLWSTNATSPSITVSVSGTYWVYVTDANGCHNTDTIIVSVLTGLEENALGNAIGFYPNPVTKEVNIKINFAKLTGNVFIRLYDDLGREVFTRETNAAIQQQGPTSIDMTALSKGVYYFEFKNEKAVVTRKIVKL